MPNVSPLNYMPDADRILTKDRMGTGTAFIFQVETRIEISEDLWKKLDAALDGSRDAYANAYALLYAEHHATMDLPGQGHAMVQAAFGLLMTDYAIAAAALERAGNMGNSPAGTP